MNWTSSPAFAALRGFWRGARIWIAAGMLSLAAGACLTMDRDGAEEIAADLAGVVPEDNGMNFSHELHGEVLTCDICHEPQDDGGFSMPSHDTCSACHEIPDLSEVEDMSECMMCHTNDSFAVEHSESPLHPDIKFAHPPHVEAEVDCAQCHENPDLGIGLQPPLKPFCMDCHGEVSPKLNECSVCHTEIGRDTVPATWYGRKTFHDAPQVWEQVHGQQSMRDPEFCMMCHDQTNDCDACHAQDPPQDHTIAFRREFHGMRATWDRNRCDACHEEDSCMKCHESTAPRSHRAGWGEPLNRHCVNCHYPLDRGGCVTCHEGIEHQEALPSPHLFGVYPPNCARCHPGGLPNRAPHMMNSSISCVVCHK